MQTTIKKKRDVKMPSYLILVGGKPKVAHKAVENAELIAVAGEVRNLLAKTVAAI